MLVIKLQNIIDSKFHYQPSWIMVIIALSVMILGYLFSAFRARFNTLIKASFSNQLSREEYSLSHPTSIFLSVNFLITASLFILQAICSKKIFPAFIDFSFLSYLLIFVFLFAVYLVKIASLKITGFIFDNRAAINEYIFIVFLINQIIGIVFIPIIIFIAYGNESFVKAFFYIGIALFISGYIIRVGKGALTIFSDGEIPAFYLFLYLCTLEILPLLLGIKLFKMLA